MTQPHAQSSSSRPAELNEANIKAAQPGATLRDPKIRGLHLRCFPTKKSFYLWYWTKDGRERKPRIGDWGSITLAKAREIAKEMLAEVAAGRDPHAERLAGKDAPTVADLWAEYWKRHGAKKKSGAEDERLWTVLIEPKLGRLKLNEVQYTTVADLHEWLGDTPVQANRTLALLSKMFAFAHRPLQWTDANPCKGVERYQERKRKRYMTKEEAGRVAAILEREKVARPQAVAFIWLLILTGARCGELAKAKWSDLKGSKIVLTEHKTDGTGEDRIIHLAPAAMDVLRQLPVVLHGPILGIASPKALWDEIRVEAECPDLRLHDLRHSFASAAVSAGLSLTAIGELLGHTNPQTTKRYAHLVEETAAAAAASTVGQIAGFMKLG